jgi:hypothetical protein
MVKWESVRSKKSLEIKGIRCIYSRLLMIKVTHTMIPGLITSWSKNHLRHRTKLIVVDVVAADKIKMLEERKGGPSRAMLKSILLSILHVYDLWASRHDLLVIPESGG